MAHGPAVNTCLDINARFGLGPRTVTFAISSLSFDLSVWDIFGTLGAGGTVVIASLTGRAIRTTGGSNCTSIK